MEKTRLTLILFALLGCSYVLSIIFPINPHDFIKDIALPIFGVFIGVLIGGVGIFLGSLGNLYNLIYTIEFKDNNLYTKYLDAINDTVSELSQNVKLSIGLSVIFLFIYTWSLVDMPFIDFPFNTRFLNKTIFITISTFFLLSLLFSIIIDSVKAMFIIHEHYIPIMKNRPKK